MAGVFEDRATWGPPFTANKKAAQLKLDGAPTLIPKPAWLYCDKAAQGVSVKLISNKGWNAASDAEAERQVDLYTSASWLTGNDEDLTRPSSFRSFSVFWELLRLRILKLVKKSLLNWNISSILEVKK